MRNYSITQWEHNLQGELVKATYSVQDLLKMLEARKQNVETIRSTRELNRIARLGISYSNEDFDVLSRALNACKWARLKD